MIDTVIKNSNLWRENNYQELVIIIKKLYCMFTVGWVCSMCFVVLIYLNLLVKPGVLVWPVYHFMLDWTVWNCCCIWCMPKQWWNKCLIWFTLRNVDPAYSHMPTATHIVSGGAKVWAQVAGSGTPQLTPHVLSCLVIGVSAQRRE